MPVNRYSRASDWVDGGPVVELTREFDAPIQLVFEAWTNALHLGQWWGPPGFTNPHCLIEPRVGGSIEIDMRGPDGVVYPNRGEVKEIVSPDLLSFTLDVLDQDNVIIIATMNTIRFTARGDRTRIETCAQSLGHSAAAEPHMAGMETGWKQTLSRLTDHLKHSRKLP